MIQEIQKQTGLSERGAERLQQIIRTRYYVEPGSLRLWRLGHGFELSGVVKSIIAEFPDGFFNQDAGIKAIDPLSRLRKYRQQQAAEGRQ